MPGCGVATSLTSHFAFSDGITEDNIFATIIACSYYYYFFSGALSQLSLKQQEYLVSRFGFNIPHNKEILRW
jgi:hypothetical protein